MAGVEPTTYDGGRALAVHWERLVENWAARRGLATERDGSSIAVRFAQPGGDLTVRFMATSRLMVAFITDGRQLRPDQLALAAAAANAWNTEQLIPMLSVWDVRGPQPCLAGVCSLPLTLSLGQAAFDDLAGDWSERAGRMFRQCRQLFEL